MNLALKTHYKHSERRSIDYYKDLGDQQRAAATTDYVGPALVLAGAGAGKTRTIVYRIAYTIQMGTDSSRIMLVTFTRKAAANMMSQLASLAGINERTFWGGTFHHLANRMLRQHAHHLGYTNDFTILDPEDSKDLVSIAAEEIPAPPGGVRVPRAKDIREIISKVINTGASIEDVVLVNWGQYSKLIPWIESVAETYGKKKLASNCMDFDDLLVNQLRLLREVPLTRSHWLGSFDSVLVDEYQDTNLLQAEILDELASPHRNLWAVGDDCQSIYKFRGANYANILEFPKRYPDLKVFLVEKNYRSAKCLKRFVPLYLDNLV